ncbi:MAG: GGDEF domain-containing protein, partial [Thermodesulfobacteriota bacterium]|nr:GGDEF domain-containing protein [Thermodesulfobacteriota bacterium]
AKRYGLDLSVMMIDVDHFKQVNDTFGHSVGDQVLQALAQLIKGSVRDFDRVFRFGGEEIVVLLPYTDVAEALVLSKRLCRRVSDRRLIEKGDEALNITISIGVSCFCPDSENEDVGTMMAQADEALYRAKSNGRNRVEVSPVPCVAQGIMAEVDARRVFTP